MYQVLGRRRKLNKGDKIYDVICEFENLQELYYMMDKVNANKYGEVLVVNKDTNGYVSSRDLEKKKVKRR